MATQNVQLVGGAAATNLKDAPVSLTSGERFVIQNLSPHTINYAELAAAPTDLGATARHEIPPNTEGFPWASAEAGADGFYVWCDEDALIAVSRRP